MIDRRNSHFVVQEGQPLLTGAQVIYPKETMADASKLECWFSPRSINVLYHLAGQQFQQHVFFGGTLGYDEGGAMYTLVSVIRSKRSIFSVTGSWFENNKPWIKALTPFSLVCPGINLFANAGLPWSDRGL